MFKKMIPDSAWLVYDDNPIMHAKNEDLTFPLNEKDIEIISKMISYVDASYDNSYKKYKIKPGIGIAANQLGYCKKIIYIHLDNTDDGLEYKLLLANPKIIKQTTKKMYISLGEGCLSVKKDHKGYSIRSSSVIVEAIDIFTQQKIEIKATGLLSACLQHEIDHTNNLFYYDKINKNDPFYNEKDWEII